MSNAVEKYNVSRETIERLKIYEKLVLEWNNKFNLISKSSIETIWNRHIEDSIQVCDYITKNDTNLIDFGSGAGFPAIVVAIMSKELFPNLDISLVESIRKKADFLELVNKELSLNMKVYNDRIENLNLTNIDIITSRALANLSKLLEYSKPFCSEKTKLVFLKGEKWQEEISIAEEKWNFIYKDFESITNPNGRVLLIEKLRSKKNG